MIDVKNQRCEYKDCIIRPSLGLEWQKPTHCLKHALKNMKNVVDKRCESEACTFYELLDRKQSSFKLANKYYCSHCYYYILSAELLPNSKKVRKEQFILAEMQRQMPELEEYFSVWDCPVDGGCSKKNLIYAMILEQVY